MQKVVRAFGDFGASSRSTLAIVGDATSAVTLRVLSMNHQPLAGLNHHMRSFLFVPADSERKLAKGAESGADAVILDLEDSVAADRKAGARGTALAYLRQHPPGTRKQALVVRVNALDTGLTDADLDVIVAGAPDSILLPKAEGGPAVIHLDAKLTAREAIHGLPDGSIKILALATETAASLFLCGTYRDCSPRLTGITWGAEDLSADLGAETNRDEQRPLHLALHAGAQSLAHGGRVSARAGDRHRLRRLPQHGRPAH